MSNMFRLRWSYHQGGKLKHNIHTNMSVRSTLESVTCIRYSSIAYSFCSTLVSLYIYFFSVVLRPSTGHGLLILEVSRSHTTTHHSR